MTTKFWVSDNGDVICDNHAGTYLKSAIKAFPNNLEHSTPLDNRAMYNKLFLGGEKLMCEVCAPFDSPTTKAVA
jgi:hypothetical protein